MPNKILGIDLSPAEIKIAEIEDGRVLNSLVEPVKKDGTSKELAQRLRVALSKNKIKTRNAVVSIFGSAVFYQLIELPIIPQNEVQGAIEHKAAASLPYPVSEAVIAYYKLASSGPSAKQNFFVVSISKKELDRIFGIFDLAGIKVKEIFPASVALLSVLKQKDPVCAVVNLGPAITFVALVKNNLIVFARSINLGGDALVHSLIGAVATAGGRIEIDEVQARKIKDEFGIPVDLEEYAKRSGLPAAEIQSLFRPVLEKLGAEVLRTFEYYRQQTGDETEFKKVYMTGPEVRIKNLVEYFNGMLSLNLELLNYTGVSAVGSSSDVRLSLMPSERKFPLLFMAKKVLNVWVGTAVVLFVMAWVFSSYSNYNAKLQKELGRLQHELRIKGINVLKPSAAEDIVSNLIKEFGPEDNFLDLLKKSQDMVPESVYFDSIKYNKKARELRLGGVVLKDAKDSAIAAFMKKLQETGYFVTIDLLSLDEVDKYTEPVYQFNIKAVFYGEKK